VKRDSNQSIAKEADTSAAIAEKAREATRFPTTLFNSSRSNQHKQVGETAAKPCISSSALGRYAEIDYWNLTDVFVCVNRKLNSRQQKMGCFWEMEASAVFLGLACL
jgi:hypothetical protein